MLSISEVGKISICSVFRSGSNPGISKPFKMVLLYLSPIPRIKIYFPLATEMPGTLRMAEAASESPVFLKLEAEIPSIIFADFSFMRRIAFSVFFLYSACTVTSPNSVTCACNSVFSTSVTFSAVTSTPFIAVLL